MKLEIIGRASVEPALVWPCCLHSQVGKVESDWLQSTLSRPAILYELQGISKAQCMNLTWKLLEQACILGVELNGCGDTAYLHFSCA